MYFPIIHNNSQDEDKSMNSIKLLLSKLPDALYNKHDTFLNFEDAYALYVFHDIYNHINTVILKNQVIIY